MTFLHESRPALSITFRARANFTTSRGRSHNLEIYKDKIWRLPEQRKSIFRQLYHKQEKKLSALRVNLTCGTQEKEEGNK
jgi:hypothetical protein